MAFLRSLEVGDVALAKARALGTSIHYEWVKGTVSGRNGDALVMKLGADPEPKNAFPGDLRPLRARKRGGGEHVTLTKEQAATRSALEVEDL